jgi:hypothetical protein
LECGGGISEAKEHDKGFEHPLVSLEGCFPLIFFFYSNIVIPPSNIKFGVVGVIFDFVNDFANQGKGIMVFHSHVIKLLVILNGAKSSTLLFDEEEGGRNRGFRGVDLTSLEIVFEEFVEDLLFVDRKGVSLGFPSINFGSFLEFDGVIPFSMLGKLIKGTRFK